MNPKDIECRCAVCGSPHVQYPVWRNPNTGETGELFGSWNAGDNSFCEDCDSEGRDPNPPLVDRGGGDAKDFARVARKYARTLKTRAKEIPSV